MSRLSDTINTIVDNYMFELTDEITISYIKAAVENKLKDDTIKFNIAIKNTVGGANGVRVELTFESELDQTMFLLKWI